jgi:hypothetical protein
MQDVKLVRFEPTASKTVFDIDADRHEVELNSVKHPSHLFQIGYFRSSYYPGGFNPVINRIVNEDLFSIFEIGEEPKFTQHNWERVKQRVYEVRQKLLQHRNDCGAFHTCEVVKNPPSVNSANEAIALFRQECNHSSSGHFRFKETLKTVAVLRGLEETTEGFVPVSYLICELDFDWYFQALDIIEETCDYVLSQPDHQNYYLWWT